jgi:protein-L-isoaspartate(D-aspartate) O-methyltransferase
MSVAPKAGDRVLHVGAGTGYYSAILAELVGPAGWFEAREINPRTSARARQCLAGRANVRVVNRSGTETGLPVVDVIYVNAGAPRVITNWLDALTDGGRLIFPLTTGFEMGGMLLITRRDNDYAAGFICRAAFIPCIGAEDPKASDQLVEGI